MFGREKDKKNGANVIQLDPNANKGKKQDDDLEKKNTDKENLDRQTGAAPKDDKAQNQNAVEKKIKFNVELQILRLGRNESVQMESVEAASIEEANETAVEVRSEKLKEGYSCTPTGRYSKEDL